MFAERSAGQSASGQSLPTITVLSGDGGNLISGNLSPNENADDWQKCQTRYYDTKRAKYVTVDQEERQKPDTVTHSHRFTAQDADAAKRRAGSNKTEADWSRGAVARCRSWVISAPRPNATAR